MMILRTIVLAAPILILGCSVPANPNVREQAPAYKEANGAGVSFTYSTSDFAKAEMSKQKNKVPRALVILSKKDSHRNISASA